MNPGALDQRVRIETQVATADGYGGTSLAWSLVAEVWAMVRPVSGRERVAAAAIEAPAMYRFTLRRRTGLTEALRVVWNGQAYNVRFIADAGPRAAYVTLDADRGVAI